MSLFNILRQIWKKNVTVGLGGGYNERGKVEYKDRVPSDDDEYDDVCSYLQYKHFNYIKKAKKYPLFDFK